MLYRYRPPGCSSPQIAYNWHMKEKKKKRTWKSTGSQGDSSVHSSVPSCLSMPATNNKPVQDYLSALSISAVNQRCQKGEKGGFERAMVWVPLKGSLLETPESMQGGQYWPKAPDRLKWSHDWVSEHIKYGAEILSEGLADMTLQELWYFPELQLVCIEVEAGNSWLKRSR